jgi:hypothetical protein
VCFHHAINNKNTAFSKLFKQLKSEKSVIMGLRYYLKIKKGEEGREERGQGGERGGVLKP